MRRHNNAFRFFAALAASLCILTMLPLAANAADEVGKASASGVTDETEKTYFTTSSAYAGKSLTIYVPVTANAAVTELSAKVAVTGNPDTFPFVDTSGAATEFEARPYQKWDETNQALVSWDGAALGVNERAYFRLTATFLESVAPGTKHLDFVVSYTDSGANPAKAHINVDVSVLAPNVTPTPYVSSGGSGFRSKPKVIVESYRFSSDVLYAGETTTLTLVIRNTSATEAVRNLQLNFADESGSVLPASGAGNSIYIGEIKKGESYLQSINLQIAPDADPKAHMLAVTLAYEGTRNKQEFTENASVSIPVQQKARVKINDPVVYDDPWANSPVSVGITLYNMGKAPLYNCMIDVVGDNYTLEEPYFGGNIASGGTLRADLNVTPLVGGDVTGSVRVTYEDVYGNPTETLLALAMFVNENSPVEMFEPTPDELASGGNVGAIKTDAGGGFAWYWWAFAGGAALTGAILLGRRIKKNRERALEDL